MPQFCILFYANYTILTTQRGWPWHHVPPKYAPGPHIQTCFPSNFMANRRVPKFSLNNCAPSSKKMFMCLKLRTNPVLKHTQCHISTNLSNFLKLCLLYCQKLLALAPTNHRFAEKNRLSGNTDPNQQYCMR